MINLVDYQCKVSLILHKIISCILSSISIHFTMSKQRLGVHVPKTPLQLVFHSPHASDAFGTISLSLFLFLTFLTRDVMTRDNFMARTGWILPSHSLLLLFIQLRSARDRTNLGRLKKPLNLRRQWRQKTKSKSIQKKQIIWLFCLTWPND